MVVKIYFFEEEKEMNEKPQNFQDFLSWIQNCFGYEDMDKFFFEYTLDGNKFYQLNNETYNTFFNNKNNNEKIYIYLSIEESNYYKQENQKEEKLEIKEEKIEFNDNNIENDSEKMNINNNNETNINNNSETNINNNIKEDIPFIIKEDEIREIDNKEESKEENKIEEIKEENKIEEIKEENKIEEKEEEINSNPNEIKLPEITKEMVIASILKGVKERRQQSRIQLEKEKKEKEKIEKEKKKKEKEKKKLEKKDKKNDFAGEISNLITKKIENFKKELINESSIKLNQIISESQIQLQKDLDQDKIKQIHSLEIHPNVSCSKCGVNPIKGNRYLCALCNNINFCDKCEEEVGFAHNHPLYKFKLRLEQ